MKQRTLLAGLGKLQNPARRKRRSRCLVESRDSSRKPFATDARSAMRHRASGVDSYNNFMYDAPMPRVARVKNGTEETGGVEDLPAVVRDMREAKGVLSEAETRTLVGVASVLAEAAESLARTAERLESMRPAEWMDAEQAAVYLANRSRDSFDKVAPSLPKHYLTERRPLYNRQEIDEWLMGR